MVCTALFDEKGEPEYYISVFNDLSEVKFKDAQIELRSNYDVLTGLPNKETFRARLAEEIRRAGDARRFAVLLFDINRFKNVNDTLGTSSEGRALKSSSSSPTAPGRGRLSRASAATTSTSCCPRRGPRRR